MPLRDAPRIQLLKNIGGGNFSILISNASVCLEDCPICLEKYPILLKKNVQCNLKTADTRSVDKRWPTTFQTFPTVHQERHFQSTALEIDKNSRFAAFAQPSEEEKTGLRKPTIASISTPEARTSCREIDRHCWVDHEPDVYWRNKGISAIPLHVPFPRKHQLKTAAKIRQKKSGKYNNISSCTNTYTLLELPCPFVGSSVDAESIADEGACQRSEASDQNFDQSEYLDHSTRYTTVKQQWSCK